MADLYPIDSEFETSVVSYLVSDKVFFGSVVKALDAEAFPTKTARTIVMLSIQFHLEHNHGPGSDKLMRQRLHHHCWDARQITVDELDECLDYIEDAKEGIADVDIVLSEFSAILRQRVEDDAFRDWAMSQDTANVKTALTLADQIGISDRSVGLGLTFDGVADDDGGVVVCPTGFTPLDHAKGGGVRGGQLLCILAATNDGKSLSLCQIAAANIREGHNVLFHACEQKDIAALSKIAADLTSIPYTDLEANVGDARARASVIMEKLGQARGWGKLSVKGDDPMFATPATTESYAEDFEGTHGAPPDVIIIDYADKITMGGDRPKPRYEDQKEVWQAYQNMAVRRQCLVVTASQAKPLDKGQIWRGKDHFRDTPTKGHVADMCISINWADDRKKGALHVFKDRQGASMYSVQIVPDWAYSRISVVSELVKAGYAPSEDRRRNDYGGSLVYLDNLDFDGDGSDENAGGDDDIGKAFRAI